ncbi:MAG: aminotransferase class V-fold PLP-dependent enzyme [Candidatus Roseilinea sp.]|uniref:aminotransferase class V-fold PLP-dependent enzyme n=1 Tax=Candidatus Roseilinea sp. TaxID=2838777 RepID=UPI00404B1068
MKVHDIARARSAIPILNQTLYLNTGTAGLTAQPVIEAMLELARRMESGGLSAYHEIQHQAVTARNRLAAFLGAGEDELAFTWNASHSLNIALQVRWDKLRATSGQPVEVLFSDHEYPTTNMIFGYLEQIGAIRLVRYRLSENTDEMLDGLNSVATDRVRMLVASHVDCNTGLRADVKTLCAWCRQRGIVSFIDGAQAIGQFHINLHDIGCDIYIGNGHKWLYGPKGVGLLYVRKEILDLFNPPLIGSGTITWASPVTFVEGASRFELTATRPAYVFAAMNAALDWFESFGQAAIERRMRELSDYFKRRVLEQPDRYTLICPVPWEQSSAMASIQFAGKTAEDISAFCSRMFQENKAVLRPVGGSFKAIRVSTAYYNIEEEYERLFNLFETEFLKP